MPSPCRIDPAQAGAPSARGRSPASIHGCLTSPRALEQQDIAGALLRIGLEVVRHRDLRLPVAIPIPHLEIDRPRHVRRQHMPLPRRILEPRQFRRPLVDHDDVGLAVDVQIGHHELVAHLQPGSDGHLPERRKTSRHTKARQQYREHWERSQHIRNQLRLSPRAASPSLSTLTAIRQWRIIMWSGIRRDAYLHEADHRIAQ